MALYDAPFQVIGERVWRTWPGGRELEKKRHIENPQDGCFPEEWMLSVAQATNVGREGIVEGLCRLAGDPTITLKEVVERHPVEMLGAEHYKRFGAGTGILVKLLDAQRRLQLQAHPDKPAARRLFNSAYGKTECWHVIALREDGEEDPCLYIGFREGIQESAWRDCFLRQDSDGMLAMLNRIVPVPGQTFIVRGGVPHAIGGGCFVVEIQEPTDLTIRLEKKMPYGGIELADEACHAGLGFDRMFECFNYDGLTEEEALKAYRVEKKVMRQTDAYLVESLIDYDVTEFFKMEMMEIATNMPVEPVGDSFSGLCVFSGTGRIDCGNQALSLAWGDQFFVPARSRPFTMTNTGTDKLCVLRFYGPSLD